MRGNLKKAVEFIAANQGSEDFEAGALDVVAHVFDVDIKLVSAAVDAIRAEAEKKAALAALEGK